DSSSRLAAGSRASSQSAESLAACRNVVSVTTLTGMAGDCAGEASLSLPGGPPLHAPSAVTAIVTKLKRPITQAPGHGHVKKYSAVMTRFRLPFACTFSVLLLIAACTAPPSRPAREPVTLLAFGDGGDAGGHMLVARAMKNYCMQAGCGFATMLGDNIY